MADEPTEVTVFYPPAAGVVIDLTAPQQVAEALNDLREWQETTYREVIRALEEALVAEADKQGRYTIRQGTVEYTVDGPDVARNVWENVPGMLAELEAAGLPVERQDELAKPSTTWKVNHRVAAIVAKNPAYAAIIDRHLTREPRKRRVDVKRAAFPDTPQKPAREFDWEAE